MEYINNSVDVIKKDLDIKEKLDLHVAKLDNDCIICYKILLKLSKENVIFWGFLIICVSLFYKVTNLD
ncbi:hypothetical protein [Spiroplasma endosymbiont of Panzeria rudis]|uniref:hypothetical protein n=1 Tax=Spiroplasma endosymbiont of Panzeria rudis TaxID=3066301 RepID=UPI0030D0E50A